MLTLLRFLLIFMALSIYGATQNIIAAALVIGMVILFWWPSIRR